MSAADAENGEAGSDSPSAAQAPVSPAADGTKLAAAAAEPAAVMSGEKEGKAASGEQPALPAATSGAASLASSASQHPLAVVLRVEVATKAQARFLTFSVYILNVSFAFMSVALFGARSGGYVISGQLRKLYRGELIVGSICLGALVFIAAWFAYQVRQAQLGRRRWSSRQAYFTRNAAFLLTFLGCYAVVYVSAFAVTLAQPNCGYNWTALAVTDFLQWTLFSAAIFFLLSKMQNMRLWRGDGALDMPVDARLQVDRPTSDKVKAQKWIWLFWLLLEALAIFGMVNKIKRHAAGSSSLWDDGCDTNLVQTGCPRSITQLVTAVVSFLIITGIIWSWVLMVKRAHKDHEQLPYVVYKATHIYVRVQSRVITPVFTSVLMSLLFLSVLPSFTTVCASSGQVQVGNMSVMLALTVAAAVMAILYMPVSRGVDSPLLQEFYQEFAWTEAGMPATRERRDQRLAALDHSAPAPDNNVHEQAEQAVAAAVAYLPGLAMEGIAKATGVPDALAAAAKLHKEPIFCLETAVRLFYWTRLAYSTAPNFDAEFVNAAYGKELYQLDHAEAVWDDTTDTHCVIGSSQTQIVVAFRGTSSTENILTDLKSWAVTYPPPHRYHGRLVKAHAGFAQAWLNNSFNEKVLERLHALDEARPSGSPPLRFWITGHSLGGALAVLGSREIAQQFPDSQLTVYTFGAPRVGNGAFAAEQEELVPDTWAIINGKDPIPWIPKWGFKRSGKRVTIDALGNLILRPSYFEMSVMERGTTAKHHLTINYALSITAVLRAQFVAGKAFSGGPQGVADLAAAVDLDKTLVLVNADLASLKDPGRRPVSAEAQEAAAKKAQAAKGGALCGSSSSGGGLCRGWCGRGGAKDVEQQAGEHEHEERRREAATE